MITLWHFAGFLAVVAFIIILGIAQGYGVQNAKDFALGGKKATASGVAMILCGTLIGGSSTVGTAELAFSYGYSAWWFTLGSSFGALMLGLVYAKPLYCSVDNATTIQDFIRIEYGNRTATICSILTSFGIIVNVVSQMLSVNALLHAILDVSVFLSIAISVLLMMAYVFFGGIKATAVLGKWKLLFLVFSVLLCGIYAISLQKGFGGFSDVLPSDKFFNIIGRGLKKDLFSGVSVALGTISTQTYIQATLAGQTLSSARKGCFLTAMITPPIGFFSMYVGMYMRINFPEISPAQAFPLFVLTYTPDIIAGVIFATLLIAIVGTAAGMALGFGTVISYDVYQQVFKKNADERELLRVTRIVIIFSLLCGGIFTFFKNNTEILHWGILSLALRAAVVPLPLTGALYFKGKVARSYAFWAPVLSLSVMLLCEFIGVPVDSLSVGLIVGGIVMLMGCIAKSSSKDKKP